MYEAWLACESGGGCGRRQSESQQTPQRYLWAKQKHVILWHEMVMSWCLERLWNTRENKAVQSLLSFLTPFWHFHSTEHCLGVPTEGPSLTLF